jgi:DNA-binding MarR family transcriptional regulator
MLASRLVAERMLVRTRDAADKRRAVLRLTPKGALINAAIAGTVEASVVRALDDMTPHEWEPHDGFIRSDSRC